MADEQPQSNARGRGRGGTRGTRGRGAGRGRGRGAAASTAPVVDPSALESSQPAAATSTPPLAQPRPPVQRLQGLARPQTVAAPIASASQAAKKAVSVPKFVGRRSKEDRAQRDAEIQAIKEKDAKDAARAARSAGRGRGDRGRGRGGRGRGGFMGDSRDSKGPIASGPFSAGAVSADSHARRSGPSMGGYGGGGGGAHVKSEGGGGGGGGGSYTRSGNDEDGVEYLSSDPDDEAEGPKKNVDLIEIVSDAEDEQSSSSHYTAAPVRMSRTEHKGRENPVGVAVKKEQGADDGDGDDEANPGQSSKHKKSKSRTKPKEVEMVRQERKWRGAWDDANSEDEVAVKPEPTEDDDVDMADIPVTDHGADEQATTASRSSKPRAPRKPHAEDEQLQTQEEKKEAERHQSDLDILRRELGELVLPVSKAEGKAKEAAAAVEAQSPSAEAIDPKDEDTTMREDTEPQQQDERADRVYLFQFPPVLPDLAVSTDGPKKEPQSPELAYKDKHNAEATPVDLHSIPPLPSEDPWENQAYNTTGLPAGRVGKLRVHASGRTTLDWGGTSLQLGMGTDVQFLQDVVVVRRDQAVEVKSEDDDKDKAKASTEGEVLALGQVKGKFVITPDWEEIVGRRI